MVKITYGMDMLEDGSSFKKFHIEDPTKIAKSPDTSAAHACVLLFPNTQNNIIGETICNWISIAMYQEC